jgi:putative ABC transport system permease protein
VGAPPLVRRRVGAAYAGFVGLVGAALGALVGLVPGIAVTFPLTSTSWESPATRAADGSALPGHFLDVPWLLMVAVVVLLPLLTATVVGLASRSRLPMVARLP